MSTEQAFEHSDAGTETGTFDTVAAAVAELERREQSRKAERKAERAAQKEQAEKPDPDDNSDPTEDDDHDPRKVQKDKPEPKPKAEKKARAEDDGDEESEQDDSEDDDAEVTPDDDEEDDTDEPKQKQKAKPSLDDDTEEVEHEGKTYRVPKALKESFLRQADYTRKTQELAQERQVVHQTYAQATETIQQVQTAQQTLMQFAQAMVGSPPPLELAEANPGEYLRQRTLHEQRQQALAEIAQQGQAMQAEAMKLQQQQMAEHMQRHAAEMVKQAPELATPQARQQFASIAGQYLQQFGFQPDDVNAITDARAILMVRRLLMLEHQLSQQAKTAGDVSKKLANVPTKTLKPGASDRQGEGKRNTDDARRKFLRSGRSMRDVEAYLKATSR